MAGKDTNPVFVQSAFRWRADDGDETGATWLEDENVNPTSGDLTLDTNHRLRIEVEETATQSVGVALAARLEYNLNGAGWNAVTTSSNVVRAVSSSEVGDEVNTTPQLTTSSRTHVAGKTSHDGLSSGIVIANQSTEFEFVFQPRSADIGSGASVQLRVTNNGTALNSYSNTPSYSTPLVDPGGSLPITDSFTDTNGTLLQDHLPDSSSSGDSIWHPLTFNRLGTPNATNASINSNRLENGFRVYRNTAVPSSAEYDVEIDYTRDAGATGIQQMALVARLTSSGLDHADVDRYQAEAQKGSTATFSEQIVKSVGGTLTTLDSVGTGADPGAGTYAYKFEVRDAAKKFYRDTAEILTTADNAITQVGRAGLIGVTAAGGATWLDNFSATEEATGAVTLSGRSATETRSTASLETPVTSLAGRSATGTRSVASLDMATQIAGRSSTGTRSEAAIATPVTLLEGRSATATRSAATLSTPVTLAGISQTPTRSEAALDTAVELSAASQTDTRSEAALATPVTTLSARSSTDTRAEASLTVATILAGRSATETRSEASIETPVSLSGRSATDTRSTTVLTIPEGEAITLSGRSATSTRSEVAIDTLVSLTGRSSTATRAEASIDTLAAFPETSSPTFTTTGNGTTHVVDLPDSIGAGNLLLIFVYSNTPLANMDSLAASGWSLIAGATADVSFARTRLFARVATGDEGETVTFSSDFNAIVRWAAFRVTAWSGSLSSVHAASAGDDEHSSHPNPPNLDPGLGTQDYLAFAYCSLATSPEVTSWPSGYPAGASNDNQHVTFRNAAVSSENPGAFTLATSTDSNSTVTVLVEPLVPIRLSGRSATAPRADASLNTEISLSGRSSTSTRAVLAVGDTATILAGRSATPTRSEATIVTPVTALSGRSSTQTRSEAAISTPVTEISGRSSTPTRSEASIAAVTLLTLRSATDTRATAALLTFVALSGRSVTSTRATVASIETDIITEITDEELVALLARGTSRSHITFHEGTHFTQPFHITGPNGSPVNLNGATLTFSVFQLDSQTPFMTKVPGSFGLQVAPSKGVILANFFPSETIDLAGNYYWELEITLVNGKTYMGGQGKMAVLPRRLDNLAKVN